MDRIGICTLCGLLNLNKPSGVTSRDVVDRVTGPLQKVKVGHAGTLDPLASGVLVVCVGAATRLIEYIQRMPKIYRTVIRLGARSDTLDRDGSIVESADPPIATEGAVRVAVAAQVGTVVQVPPQFSALKVGGRRAYDLVRAGQTVDLAPREVRIERIDVLAYDWPHLELEITCGGGTYIRSIARDLGEALGCGGLVDVLTRTRIGPFMHAAGLDPAGLTAETIGRHLRPAVEAVGDLPRVVISAEQVAAIVQGKALEGTAVAGAPAAGGEVALLGPDGALAAVAVYEPAEMRIQPKRVLAKGG